MSGIAAVAVYSLLEHLRRKLVIFFGVASAIITAVLIYLAVSNESDVIFGGGSNIASLVSLGALGTFSLIAALAVSMGNIGRPFSDGEALMLVSRPISRAQYALGRLAGSIAVITGLCLVLAAETQIVALVDNSKNAADLWGHWATQTFNLWLVVVATTLFSAFISTPVLAAIAGFFLNQVVGAAEAFYRMAEIGLIKGFLASSVRLVWYVTPKFLSSPLISRQVRGIESGTGGPSDMFVDNTAAIALWASAWLIGLILLMVLAVRNKEV